MTDETVAYMGWSISAQRHIDNFRKEVRELKAENAKLRELVRDMYEMAYPEYPSAFEAAFADRMRELGIEASADA